MSSPQSFPSQFSVPILLVIFNRPDTLEKVFEVIRKIKPRQLFITADGPRAGKEGERERCDAARRIATTVDWPCEVKTHFLEENKGCKLAVSGGIEWFFSQVDEGIILEDDCVPDESFFPFCKAMLEKYRDTREVMMVCGTNFLFNMVPLETSYFFARYYPCWGWATWKRAWQLYDRGMQRWPELKGSNYLMSVFSDTRKAGFYPGMFDDVYRGTLNSWAIPWVYSCLMAGGLAIMPAVNLISNIGTVGTHTTARPSIFNFMPVRSLDTTQLVHPSNMGPHEIGENWTYDMMLGGKGWKQRFLKFLYKARFLMLYYRLMAKLY